MSIKIEKLNNGIPVIMESIDSASTVSLGYFVKTGAVNEKEFESGVSHYIEHMMFKGTENRSAKDISEEIDNEGGVINAFTSKTITAYYVQMLSNKINKGIDILNDMFLHSTFTEENLEKERNVIIEEIRMYDDIPEDLIHEMNLSYAVTGVDANLISGTIEGLKKIDREIFLNYYKEQYVSGNMIISIAGKFNEKEILEQLNKGIGSIEEKASSREVDYSYTINSGENKISRETNQVHICFNTLGESLTSKDKYTLFIISSILAGGNMSSRLFQKIREEKGLAYSVYSYNTSFLEGGLFTVYAGTTKEAYQEVIDIIKAELEDIKENGLSEYELQKAKNQFASFMIFGNEIGRNRMQKNAKNYILFGKVISDEEIIKDIESVTLEDIKRVAKKLFIEDKYSWTILGNV